MALLGSPRSPPDACPLGDVVLWDNEKDEMIAAVSDEGSVPLRVCISNRYYAPICDNGVALFKLAENMDDFNTRSWVAAYPTSANPHAIAILGSNYFVFPGISTGMIQVVDLSNMKSAIINAHTTAIRALTLSKDEEYIATASDKGTLVRIWSAKDHSRLWEFRRGVDVADVFCLEFSSDNSFLALTSDKGTLHIFDVGRTATSLESSPDSRRTERGSSPRNQDAHSTKAIPISYHRRRSSASKRSNNDARSPRQPSKLGTSPSSPRPPRLSSPPPEFGEEDMLQSTILSASPRKQPHRPLGDDDDDEDPITDWSHLMRQKAARFQDHTRLQTPPHQPRPDSLLSSSPDTTSHSELTGTSPPGRASNTTTNNKYGNLASLPFAPRVLRDQYSAMSIPFDMPRSIAGEASSSASISSSVRSSHSSGSGGTLADGTPPKGLIAWINDHELCVISAGRRGRWERFAVSQGGGQKRSLVFVGWKPYIDED
jgi:WD40 repeat protein